MGFGARGGSLVAIALCGTALVSPQRARAVACTVDADCPHGFTCYAPPPDAGAAPSAAGPQGACLSLSCRQDADCDADLRCASIGSVCYPSADGGQSCGPANGCVPRWQAPCKVDADCGPGFACRHDGGLFACGPHQHENIPFGATTKVIACEDVPRPPQLPGCGAAGSGASSPACIPAICEPGSTCLSIDTGMCEAEHMSPCSVDADCLPMWTCECPATGHRLGGPIALADAGVAAEACTHVCTPPNSGLSFGGLRPAGGTHGPANSLPTDGGQSASGMATKMVHSKGTCQIGSMHSSGGDVGYALGAFGCVAWLRLRRVARKRRRARHAAAASP